MHEISVIYRHKEQIKQTEENKMTIKIRVRGKKKFESTIKEYRAKGYNIITFGYELVELEKDDEIVVIER
jgi:uncharacterized protein involved in tolerance to divalent cations